MRVYACVEIRNGTRLRDDGSYMTNADRAGSQPQPINDDIWYVREGTEPGKGDRRRFGYFAITVADRRKAMVAADYAAHNELAHTLRLIWDRTPFTASEIAAIQDRIPDDDPLPPIPTMTFAEFKAATIPCNSEWVKARATEARDYHAGRIRISEELLAQFPSVIGGEEAVRHRTISDSLVMHRRFRDESEAKRVRFSKRLLREEPIARRAETTRG